MVGFWPSLQIIIKIELIQQIGQLVQKDNYHYRSMTSVLYPIFTIILLTYGNKAG